MSNIYTGKYPAIEVAKYIIRTVNQNDGCISNLKLQKLLYFVQAQFLVFKGECCFADPITAWDFGPVVIPVYREYAVFGSASIPYKYLEDKIWIAPDDAELINSIIKASADMSAAYLTQVTLGQTPWKNTPNGCAIAPQDIYEFFKD